MNELTLKFNLQSRSEASLVTVELRNAISPYTLVESAHGNGGGNVATTYSFEKAVDDTPYYIVVKGASILETWSAIPVSFNLQKASFDFTSATSQAFGNNQIILNGMPSIFTGDVNQDGLIDLSDLMATYTAASDYLTGAVSTDVNGDGVVD